MLKKPLKNDPKNDPQNDPQIGLKKRSRGPLVNCLALRFINNSISVIYWR